MASESASRNEEIEARATAFVFGELDREEATRFMKAMDSSPSLRALVDSIRDAVGALQVEFRDDTGEVIDADRRKIENAIRHRDVDAPPVVSGPSEEGSRQWAVALAVAATLLLACGLTLPGLNRVITANTQATELEGRIREIELQNERLESEKRALTEQLASVKSNLKRSVSDPAFSGESNSGQTDVVPTELQGIAGTGASAPKENEVAAADLSPPDSASGMTDSQGPATEAATVAAGQDAQSGQGGPTKPNDPARVGTQLEMVAGGGAATAQGQPAIDQPEESQGDPNATSRPEMIGPRIAESEASLPVRPRPILGQVTRPNPNVIGERHDRPDSEAMEIGAGESEMEMAMETESMMDMMDDSMDDMGMGGGLGGGNHGARSHVTAGTRRALGWNTVEGDRLGAARPGMGEPMWPAAGDRFAVWEENPFRQVSDSPLSTFSADVDTSSYSKVRTYLTRYKRLPSPSAVRVEELINYFDYHYEPPQDDRPFAASMDIAECPWNPKHRLARIGVKGRVIEDDRPASNLVFLLDVSGSMNRPNRLPLVIDSMKMLVNQLDENDTVAIVVYAGAAGLVLDATSGDRKKIIGDALQQLKAGGATNGGEGIQLAYSVARDNYIEDGINRIILCSDGDFNVGVTDTSELVNLAQENAAGNLFLTVLGFGVGNHDDERMERISNEGNGNYAFVDTEDEARKVLVDQIQGTLLTIAKDVKVQVEFNPLEVQSYRLIGYENRILTAKDFRDDSKDAGDIGAGHTVTALYEIVPTTTASSEDDDVAQRMSRLKYQKQIDYSDEAASGEALTLKLAYKLPTETRSRFIELAVKNSDKPFHQTDSDFQFASAVAAFGMLLQHSPYKGSANFDMVEEIATAGAIGDRYGYREEFVSLVRQARKLAGG